MADSVLFNYSQVEATLPSLTPLDRNLILKEHPGSLASPLTEIPAGLALVLWLANALVKVSPINAAEQRAIIARYRSAVFEGGQKLAGLLTKRDTSEIPAMRLAIFDRKYATLSGETGYLDLHDGSNRNTLSRSFFESLVYDLTALYMSSCVRMHKIAEVKAKFAKEPPACQPSAKI